MLVLTIHLQLLRKGNSKYAEKFLFELLFTFLLRYHKQKLLPCGNYLLIFVTSSWSLGIDFIPSFNLVPQAFF